MKLLKSLLFLFAILSVLNSSCSTNTTIATPTGVMLTPETKVATTTPTPRTESLPTTQLSTSVNGMTQILLFDDWPKDGFLNDAAKITSITLEKDILRIEVIYQGGCQEHTFALYAATAFLQSLPPQALLYLSHDSHGDTCTGNVEKRLSFDLTPLNKVRDQPGGHPLILRVYEPVGAAFAKEPHMSLIEWP